MDYSFSVSADIRIQLMRLLLNLHFNLRCPKIVLKKYVKIKKNFYLHKRSAAIIIVGLRALSLKVVDINEGR